MSNLIPIERIESRIIVIRGEKVLLDRDLAELYEVTTGNLNKAVSRNLDRFPEDFMFRLENKELDDLIFQNGTSRWGGTRKKPRAFTEQGVAMLSGILRSQRATTVNIAIMRTFVQIRRMIRNDGLTKIKLEDIEDRLGAQEFQTLMILDQLGAIKKKLTPSKLNKPMIGFPVYKKDH